jgi:hypothetical protein
MRRILGPEREERRDVKKLPLGELNTFYCPTYYYREQIEEGENYI